MSALIGVDVRRSDVRIENATQSEKRWALKQNSAQAVLHVQTALCEARDVVQQLLSDAADADRASLAVDAYLLKHELLVRLELALAITRTSLGSDLSGQQAPFDHMRHY